MGFSTPMGILHAETVIRFVILRFCKLADGKTVVQVVARSITARYVVSDGTWSMHSYPTSAVNDRLPSQVSKRPKCVYRKKKIDLALGSPSFYDQ